jgi:hypothetical protein
MESGLILRFIGETGRIHIKDVSFSEINLGKEVNLTTNNLTIIQ